MGYYNSHDWVWVRRFVLWGSLSSLAHSSQVGTAL